MDLRRGFNGLMGLVESKLRIDLPAVTCSCFLNRCRTSSKVFLWDGTGLGIYMKRPPEPFRQDLAAASCGSYPTDEQ